MCEIPDDAYTVTPSGTLGGLLGVGCQEGFLGEYPGIEEALEAIREDMAEKRFWPEVYWVSDHGNAWPISVDDGHEIEPL